MTYYVSSGTLNSTHSITKEPHCPINPVYEDHAVVDGLKLDTGSGKSEDISARDTQWARFFLTAFVTTQSNVFQ